MPRFARAAAGVALVVLAAAALALSPWGRERLPDPVRHALGIGEGCLACHGAVAGLEGAHAPARIGCASCHGGDARSRDKTVA
ncbi:MAG TPA: hypothetical protein PLO00_07820, partial [Usitatibacteraceae bacterium]|nr:hypothetical protein [Usitatibacteraceae bacterium]